VNVDSNGKTGALILGVFICLGLTVLGSLLGNAAIKFKEYERSVTVKGLSEREYPADIVIWPIQYTEAGNDLGELYETIENGNAKIRAFLEQNGIRADEISLTSPSITDKLAHSYSGGPRAEFRYSAVQTVTVYSTDIDKVRAVKGALGELVKQGIVITGGGYQGQTEYLFTRLNEVKPAMIEEATRKAREVAEKFAQDSRSKLGKIKRASQGQFSINNRDNNNPHIKKLRVVATVEYYLSD
jgi:hypothetical protein